MITKEKFEIYEKIRNSNVKNMLEVQKLSEKLLSKQDVIEIMKNYSSYQEKFK